MRIDDAIWILVRNNWGSGLLQRGWLLHRWGRWWFFSDGSDYSNYPVIWNSARSTGASIFRSQAVSSSRFSWPSSYGLSITFAAEIRLVRGPDASFRFVTLSMTEGGEWLIKESTSSAERWITTLILFYPRYNRVHEKCSPKWAFRSNGGYHGNPRRGPFPHQ